MDGANLLLQEDRPDYERVLDEALRRVRQDAGPAAAERFRTERLRRLGMEAAPLVAPRAAAEYEHYVAVRSRLRVPASTAPSSAPPPVAPSPAAPAPDVGVGAGALASVLLPVLAGISALVFLLFGYGLSLADPEPPVAASMRTAGWVFAVLTAIGLAVAAVELLIGALRNGATSVRAARPGRQAADAAPTELVEAREAWQRALLERGLLPFLHETVGGESVSDNNDRESRTPKLKFSSPKFSTSKDRSGEKTDSEETGSRFGRGGFSSPKSFSRDGDAPDSGSGSRFSSPKFSSRTDEGEQSGERSAPGYASPSYRSSSESSDDSGSRFGRGGFASPSYRSSSDSSESGESEGSGSRFGKGGFASPAYRSSSESSDDSGSRFGRGGFASPSYRSSSDSSESGESEGSGSRFGKGGFAGPKLAGSDREEGHESTEGPAS
ncbi:hypothetical protein [Streptomyces bohaiensis]|uniref:hypothetical protein n=1 Tax=Streptomyces bohaiensis TaxID=1431344 RepID=UPI003B82B4B1